MNPVKVWNSYECEFRGGKREDEYDKDILGWGFYCAE